MNKSQMETNSQDYPSHVPITFPAHNNSVYLSLRPSTMRYRLLMTVASETGADWRDVARLAIDWYLNLYFKQK